MPSKMPCGSLSRFASFCPVGQAHFVQRCIPFGRWRQSIFCWGKRWTKSAAFPCVLPPCDYKAKNLIKAGRLRLRSFALFAVFIDLRPSERGLFFGDRAALPALSASKPCDRGLGQVFGSEVGMKGQCWRGSGDERPVLARGWVERPVLVRGRNNQDVAVFLQTATWHYLPRYAPAKRL